MEDKNIDRLFQEKLKDLEVMPNPELWQNIEDKLSKKKKKRIIPFWWFSSGIAAVLLISLLITNPFKNDATINFPTPVNEDFPVVETQQIKVDTTTSKFKETIPKEEVTTELVENKLNQKKTDKTTKNTIEIAKTETNKSFKEKLKTKTNSSKKETNKILKKKEVHSFKKDVLIADNQVEKTKNKEDKITKKTKETKQALVALVDENPIEEEKIKTSKKWSVTPIVGVIGSSAFSGGSPIDESLNSNSISTDGTLAYGVKVGYQLNEKWSIRTGVQFQKNVINTENVGLFTSVTSNNNLEAINFSINDAFTFVSLEPSGDSSFALDPTNSGGNLADRGSIAQTYSYFEIPVEVQYQFYENKTFKTQLVTGFSTLFLNENSVALNSSILNQPIGEANNLNTLNFSGNLGINIDVQLSKKLNLNFNPMLKAQLNTFSENSNGFSPFIFGIYSGVTFDF
ncbi:outer membrane beta-barrel protein [uncultured Tenacibaculum sp.]|uniref:outer membrane beta-barrel protein n=1 Tax=uncultured Tenacibaculum sp. TaxID=174713 RepID=UPI00260BF851|nr:outer membrane beta-barrel protein [uncultured Tenacibaculum sp.]